MSEASQGDPMRAAADLRLALDRFSDACIAADVDGLLASEAGLAAALSAMRRPLAPPTDPDLFRLEIELLRRALQRAERVGASFDDTVRASIGLLAPAALYNRDGREHGAAPGAALEARG